MEDTLLSNTYIAQGHWENHDPSVVSLGDTLLLKPTYLVSLEDTFPRRNVTCHWKTHYLNCLVSEPCQWKTHFLSEGNLSVSMEDTLLNHCYILVHEYVRFVSMVDTLLLRAYYLGVIGRHIA